MPLVVLLDTNVWVSAFLKPTGPPGQVLTAWKDDAFNAITSLPQLGEIADVLSRSRLVQRFRYTSREAEVFVRLIAARGTIVQISGGLKICRDPDDDEILEAAIVGKSQYLVTRDDDLKRDLDLIKMARRHRVRVVSIRRFLRRLERQAKW
ncbi:MAG TPA: putative toxin-antitoxin system toxin component, PIN family [Candidatus Binatia bacterium]|nr:putative toxin-antitoxin system toxin component, PIN family [Candidatus Binatia bacterium]